MTMSDKAKVRFFKMNRDTLADFLLWAGAKGFKLPMDKFSAEAGADMYLRHLVREGTDVDYDPETTTLAGAESPRQTVAAN